MAGCNSSNFLKLKKYFSKRFNSIALIGIVSSCMCDMSYATDKTLEGGGTDLWIVQCTALICGTQSAYDNLTVQNGDNSGNFTFTSIEFQTATVGGDRGLTIKANPDTGKITIDRLFTSHYGIGTTGFNASLSVNANTHIKSLEYINVAAPLKGTSINISIGEKTENGNTTYTKDLTIDKISFNHNGLAGTNGYINIKAKDITIDTAAGRLSHNLNVQASGNITANDVYFDGIGGVGGFAVIPKSNITFDAQGGSFTSKSVKGMGHSDIYIKAKDKVTIDNVTFAVDICITQACAGYIQLQSTDSDVIVKSVSGGTSNESGIGSFNRLKIIGKNFYAGKVEAISLVTALNNSYLDLSEVKGTTFIDDLYFRNGTLTAKDFHFNNFTVYKANANRVGSEHPTAGSAYTSVNANIGKSFINYLSMEIGTSNTADSAALWFKNGGEILNLNLIDARATSYINFGDIKNININTINATETSIYMKNGIINTLTNKKGQTAIASNSKITANALNINELLHIKDGSKHSGVMNIVLNGNEDVNQDFSKYLNVGVDSNTLKNMSKDELQKLIDDSKAQNTNITESDYKNTSGTYITTSDGKHYLLLPDIMTNENITNNTTQATNGGNLLIEQTALTKGALNNYGKILLDAGFVSGDKPKLSITGNLNNYNEVDIGANGSISVTGDFNNKGQLTFRIQSDPKDSNQTEVKNGSMTISGKTTFDISPGSSGAFKADISDAKTLSNLSSSGVGKQYNLITAGSISYTYTKGDYTTTFSKDNGSTSIKTQHSNGGTCTNQDCQTGSNGNTKQETDFTTNGKENPWDMDKAQSDSSGNRVENGVGENDNHGNLIHKPSQSDKKEDCKNNGTYCGFGNDANATEADRGYDYAQERMKNSFALTYKGGSIDGKYIKVEKIVNDTTIGFKITKIDINDFIGGDAETPLCNSESSTFDCALYMEAGGNNSWINAIKKESANSYEILKNLFYNDDSSLVFLVNLDQTLAASRNLAYFLEVGRTLDTAFKHVANLENKASTLHTLSLAMESARINRLAKIASIHGSASSWLAMQNYEKNLEFALKEAEKLRFASVDDDSVNNVWFDTLADLVMRFNQREEYPNHAWINMLGNFNFSGTGTAQLYGFNAGYDYFVDSLQTAFGLYAGYGYGTFNGNNNGFTSNTSNNIFAGIYTRTFIENHEIDVTLNSTTGLVNENQNSRINNMDLLTLFKDSYNYTLSNIDLNATYGYAFLLKKGYIVKPFAGLSYYVLHSSPFTHTSQGTIFSLDTADNTRQTLSVNIGVDGRKYFANQSYVFLVGQLKQDAIILQNNLNSQGYVSTEIGDSVTNFNMSYKAQGYRSYVFLTGGGEYSFGRWYLNGSLSVQSSVFDKNFGFGFNLGGRVVF